MKRRRNTSVTIIRRSCLTGNAVWVYQGASDAAAWMAYSWAAKQEIQRMKRCADMSARRRSNIARLLNDCLAELPLNAELSPEQKESARLLNRLSTQPTVCHSEFYEHIMEERRRKKR